MPEIIESIDARALATQANVLRTRRQVGSHEYVNLILPTLDVVQGGVVDSRVQKAIFTQDATTAAAGAVFQRMLISPPEGVTIRVRRVQAFVMDPAAATSWVTAAIRTVTSLAIVGGMPSVGRIDELDAFYDPNVTNLSAPVGGVLATPFTVNGSFYDEELAQGTTRVTYAPADGYIVSRPPGGVVTPEALFSIGAQYARTAAAAGEMDQLVVIVTYTACGYGAFPAR